MRRNDVYESFLKGFLDVWKLQLLQGILFILYAVAILFFPPLLIVLVSSFFMMVGIILVSFAWGLRRCQKDYDSFRGEVSASLYN